MCPKKFVTKKFFQSKYQDKYCNTSDMYKKGIFPLHNRFLVTAEFLMEFYNTLSLNSSTIEAIKKKMYLLGLCEGISHLLDKNIQNLCNDLEGLCTAAIALLVTPTDLDHVISVVFVPKLSIPMVMPKTQSK